jgi:hypothetical protein
MGKAVPNLRQRANGGYNFASDQLERFGERKPRGYVQAGWLELRRCPFPECLVDRTIKGFLDQGLTRITRRNWSASLTIANTRADSSGVSNTRGS